VSIGPATPGRIIGNLSANLIGVTVRDAASSVAKLHTQTLLLGRRWGYVAVAAASVGHSLGTAVLERPGPAADMAACS
jgi:hypothetical protein